MSAKTNREDRKQTESLADLPLTTEQAEETTAGTHAGGGGHGAGKVQMQDFHFVMR